MSAHTHAVTISAHTCIAKTILAHTCAIYSNKEPQIIATHTYTVRAVATARRKLDIHGKKMQYTGQEYAPISAGDP